MFDFANVEGIRLTSRGTLVQQIMGSLHQQPGREIEIFTIVKDASVVRVIRTADMRAIFMHSAPGTGTRALAAELPADAPSSQFQLMMTWDPDGLQFVVRWISDEQRELEPVIGCDCTPPYKLQVAENGDLVVIGSPGVETSGFSVWLDGKPHVRPPACDYWSRTLAAVDELASAATGRNYDAERAVSNAAIMVMVSGFEAYVRMRLVEIDREGGRPDMARFYRKELSAAEQLVTPAVIEAGAQLAGETPLQHFVRVRRPTAQSYDRAKDLFNWLYGVSIANLGIKDSAIGQVRIAVTHRHYLTHEDPAAMAVLDASARLLDAPSARFVTACREAFDEVVTKIHRMTLTLALTRMESMPRPE